MLWHFAAIALLFALSHVQQVTGTTPVRQCCPEGKALHLQFYECREYALPIRSQALEETLRLRNFSLKQNGPRFPTCGKEEVFLNKDLEYLTQKTVHLMTDLCIAVTTDNNFMLIGCVPLSFHKRVSEKVSIRKCCPMFQQTMAPSPEHPPGTCNETTTEFQPKFFGSRHKEQEDMYPSNVDIISPGCVDKDLLYDVEHYLLSNGSLSIPNLTQMLDRDDYCIDNVEGFDSVQTFYCTGTDQDGPLDGHKLEYALISLGLSISIVFLLATFLIYACECKKQNLYGWTLMCHVGSITIAFICLMCLQLQPLGFQVTDHFCYVIAYLMQFAFLSAFFWLNVMSFDIWRTFRNIRSRDTAIRRNKMIRFTLYSTYAWGMPILLTFLTYIVITFQLFPTSVAPDIQKCWFSPKKSYGYYIVFIAPISCIILCNVVLCVITAWRCYLVKKDINKMHEVDKKQKSKTYFKKKEQLVLTVKLFLVMGITWSLEVISFLFKQTSASSVPHVWYITDAVNALHGLIIFIIFALKKKNIRNVSRRFSTWVDKRRFGTDALMNLRKTSTTMNPSSISYDTDTTRCST